MIPHRTVAAGIRFDKALQRITQLGGRDHGEILLKNGRSLTT
jgi:hypothetical protein